IIRRILRARSRSGYLGWTFGGLWIIGWIAATLFAASISKDLREYEHNDSPVSITQPAHGRMIVKVSEPALEYTGNFAWLNNESTGWDLSEDSLKLSAIRFDVALSEDSDYHVVLKKYSAGSTRAEARSRADKIQYNISYTDSILDLGSGYAIDKDSKFRGQKIDIEIRVPAGKKIRFDGSVEDRLNPFNVRIKRYRGWRNNIRVDINESEDFPWNVNTDYTMGKDGLLHNPNGSSVEENNDYRYKQTDSLELDKNIQQKEKELNNLKEKKKKLQDKPVGYLFQHPENKKIEMIAITPSPFLSLLSTYN
ncbi:MAG: hypothetical protein ACRDE5_18725, partial [Ginsengibacter sp.]